MSSSRHPISKAPESTCRWFDASVYGSSRDLPADCPKPTDASLELARTPRLAIGLFSPAFVTSSPAGGGLAAGCPNDRRLWIDLKWATKRHANGNAVFLRRIDQKIGDDGEIVHKRIAEQAEHCL